MGHVNKQGLSSYDLKNRLAFATRGCEMCRPAQFGATTYCNRHRVGRGNDGIPGKWAGARTARLIVRSGVSTEDLAIVDAMVIATTVGTLLDI